MASDEDLFMSEPDLTAGDLMAIDRRCAISRATPQGSRLDMVHDILRNTFQLSGFRPKQLDAINAALEGRDVFVRFPTSGGKSLCFQLPAIYELKARQAITFVIQPSVELIKNQVATLERLGVGALIFEPLAQRIGNYWDILIEEMRTPFCFFTPQMLRPSDYLRDILAQLHSEERIARFVIDEAHVTLNEENGFGIAYRELGLLRSAFPNVPIMALSASTPPDSMNEICHRLQMKDVFDVSTATLRTNLRYSVIFRDGKFLSGIEILHKFLGKYRGKKGLVFCRTINDCKKVAASLQRKSWKANQYHAGLRDKKECLKRFTQYRGGLDILVTTKVLGVGVNLPNLKFVVHWEAPYRLTEYLQQSGRAGRDDEPAECVLLFSPHSMSKVPHDEPQLNGRDIQERTDMITYAMSRRCRQASHPNALADVRCNVCDNCHRKSMFIRSTERTNVILGVFKEFPRNPLPTLKQLMDHLLGHNRKAELDKSLRMDQYGIGRDRRLRFIDIEYLLMRALMDSLLKEILVPCETPRGYCSYAYLEPDEEGGDLLRKARDYSVDFSPLKPVEM